MEKSYTTDCCCKNQDCIKQEHVAFWSQADIKTALIGTFPEQKAYFPNCMKHVSTSANSHTLNSALACFESVCSFNFDSVAVHIKLWRHIWHYPQTAYSAAIPINELLAILCNQKKDRSFDNLKYKNKYQDTEKLSTRYAQRKEKQVQRPTTMLMACWLTFSWLPGSKGVHEIVRKG